MFSKHGRKMVELQQQITLRTLSHEIVGVHATLPNGGEAGLAKLETAQKILASPALLAQFKKDAALSKKAQANAVAWLNDIRTEKEATEALSKVCFLVFYYSSYHYLSFHFYNMVILK